MGRLREGEPRFFEVYTHWLDGRWYVTVSRARGRWMAFGYRTKYGANTAARALFAKSSKPGDVLELLS